MSLKIKTVLQVGYYRESLDRSNNDNSLDMGFEGVLTPFCPNISCQATDVCQGKGWFLPLTRTA